MSLSHFQGVSGVFKDFQVLSGIFRHFQAIFGTFRDFQTFSREFLWVLVGFQAFSRRFWAFSGIFRPKSLKMAIFDDFDPILMCEDAFFRPSCQ